MKLRIPAAAALVLLCFAACAASPTPIPNRDRRDAVAKDGTALRVMSFNVHRCKEGLAKIADVIRRVDADVVGLQEIVIGDVDQLAELAARSGYRHFRFVRAARLHGGDYGIALLSRFPIESLETRALPVHGHEPRVVAHAVVRAAGREVSIYKTHLTAMPMNSELRAEQARLIRRLMRRDPRPKLLLGDMNDIPSSEALRTLSANLVDTFDAAGHGPAGTFALPLPIHTTFRYDYVLASRDWDVKRSFVIHAPVSDHYPVVSDLVLPDLLVQGGPAEPQAPQSN